MPAMVQQVPQALHTSRELPEAAAITISLQAGPDFCAMVVQAAIAGRLTLCACRSCGLCQSALHCKSGQHTSQHDLSATSSVCILSTSLVARLVLFACTRHAIAIAIANDSWQSAAHLR